jgi:hypothetical protein
MGGKLEGLRLNRKELTCQQEMEACLAYSSIQKKYSDTPKVANFCYHLAPLCFTHCYQIPNPLLKSG